MNLSHLPFLANYLAFPPPQPILLFPPAFLPPPLRLALLLPPLPLRPALLLPPLPLLPALLPLPPAPRLLSLSQLPPPLLPLILHPERLPAPAGIHAQHHKVTWQAVRHSSQLPPQEALSSARRRLQHVPQTVLAPPLPSAAFQSFQAPLPPLISSKQLLCHQRKVSKRCLHAPRRPAAILSLSHLTRRQFPLSLGTRMLLAPTAIQSPLARISRKKLQ